MLLPVFEAALRFEPMLLFGAATAAAVWSGADTIWSSDVNVAVLSKI